MATIAAIAGLAISAGGTAMSVMGARQQAKQQEAMSKYNARVSEQQARIEEQRTAIEEERQLQEAERTQSSLRAALGASNVVVSEGTPLLIQKKQKEQSDLELALIGYEGQVRAMRARSQAGVERAQAKAYGRQATIAPIIEGIRGAGSTLPLLTGFSKIDFGSRGNGTASGHRALKGFMAGR